MISYLGYKVLHLAGVFLLLLSLGGTAVLGSVLPEKRETWRRLLSIAHGLGILLLLIAGFGLLARLGASWPWQGWILLKLLLWVLLGALPVAARRLPDLAIPLWWVAFAAALAAGWLAVYKPF
jgi:hypothetical protein